MEELMNQEPDIQEDPDAWNEWYAKVVAIRNEEAEKIARFNESLPEKINNLESNQEDLILMVADMLVGGDI